MWKQRAFRLDSAILPTTTNDGAGKYGSAESDIYT
jgi:hypothetical protein